MNEKNKNFDLPKNIKQMGSIDNSFKIYMEDYVFTYLQQYAKEGKGEERSAILVGESYSVDGSEIVFISGAIKPEHTMQENGIIKFSEKSFEHIDKQIQKYFNGQKIVGWFYSQPGFSDYINDEYIKYHKEIFKEKNQVFFLNDPLENIGCFYKFLDNNFYNISGFIIYYEKNEQMSEYMLNNKPLTTKSEEKRFRAKDEKLLDISRKANNQKNSNMLKEYKKMTNVFGSLSAVLFLVCFIMGAGLMQSDDRISELEKRLVKLDESYRYVLSEVKNDKVQSVFAQDISMQETTNIEQTSKEETSIKTEETTESTTKVETVTQNNNDKKQYKTYVVEEGDSLELISKKIYGDRKKISEIMQLNNITDANKIFVGMKIKLP